MLESLKNVVKPLLQISSKWGTQSVRTTFVLKRRYPPRPPKFSDIRPKKPKRRDFVFDLVHYENDLPKPPIEIILLKYVDDVGAQGDVVSMPPIKAYEELLLPGLAVYATEENLKKYTNIVGEQVYSSKYVKELMRFLSTQLVHVLMSNRNSWTIEPWHIRVALRREGIIAEEESIELPEMKISGPDEKLEMKEFPVKITINNTEKVLVRCRIQHWNRSEKGADFKSLFWNDEDNRKVCEPIAEEFRETLQSMPRPILKEKGLVIDAPWMI